MNSHTNDSRIVEFMLPIMGGVLCIVLWEANSYFHFYSLLAPSLPPAVFPSFFSIASRFISISSSVDFWDALYATTFRTFCAFGIAAFFGVLFGMLVGRIRLVDALTVIPVEFFRNLPAVAIMPVFIILLGIGASMKVAIAIFGSIFPIFIATREGVKNIDEEIHIAARFYGWRGRELILKVLLPAALPEIASASQTALSISLILVVMGEMLIGGDGLGSKIVDAERTFNHLDLYALIFALGILGSLLAIAFRWGILKVIYWKNPLDWQRI